MKRETSDKKILDIIAAVLQQTPEVHTHAVLNQIASLVRETGRVTWAANPTADDDATRSVWHCRVCHWSGPAPDAEQCPICHAGIWLTPG